MPPGEGFGLLADDVLEHVLLLAGHVATANLGLASTGLRFRILTTSPTVNYLWRTFAAERWGHAVTLEGDEDIVDDRTNAYARWYVYYRRRCSTWSTPPSPSPLGLIQEPYAADPYTLLTSCILCSRTSGSEIIRTVVGCFLDKYPTPTHVLEGDTTVMAKELHPLGLNRERTMKLFAAGFLKANWTNVTDLHGCGAFASSSHDVFCLGNWVDILNDKTADRNVQAYAAFCKTYLATREGDSKVVVEEDRDQVLRAKIKQENAKRRQTRRKPRQAISSKHRKKVPAKGERRSQRRRLQLG